MTWENRTNHYRACMITVTMAMGSVFAGPNKDAGLFVDVDYRTAAADSLGTAAYDAPFWIGVRVADVRYLDTFGFRLGFDSSLVAFVKAVPESPADGAVDFLESKGGTSIGFLGRISGLDSAQVTVTNGLAGQDSSKAPSGSGLLVLMEFIAKASAPGKAGFSISDVKLLDWRQNLDTAVAVHGGAVVLQSSDALSGSKRPRRAEASRLGKIAIALDRSPSRSGFYLLGRSN